MVLWNYRQPSQMDCWIYSYLIGGSVLFKWKNSSWKGVKSSIPQESILGPLLFLTYVNDNLPSCFYILADVTILSLCNTFLRWQITYTLKQF